MKTGIKGNNLLKIYLHRNSKGPEIDTNVPRM